MDSNILIYASRSESPFHEAARRAVRSLAEGEDSWAIPWPCVYEFLRNVTHSGIYMRPTPLAEALSEMAELCDSPAVQLIGATADHRHSFFSTVAKAVATANVVYDASIAAICIEHRVSELWTVNTRHFDRFNGLKVHNPLV
ncbi:MAG: TA system VapC family ribonuclease toxin [Bryobacteraceae bacterium]|nr:TA system VapC family ribonuclease toxin [Bryobacteraceae bacterium]